MSLFEGSLSDHAQQMSDKEVQSTIRRLRTQRDKYQDLLRRQRVSTRERSGTKSGESGTANARTHQKAQVFSETLERMEKQHAKRERAAAKPMASRGTPKNTVRSAVRGALASKKSGESGKPQAGRSSKAPARGPCGRSGSSSATQAPATVPHTKRSQDMGQQRPLAHVSSRGRTSQARRDSR